MMILTRGTLWLTIAFGLCFGWGCRPRSAKVSDRVTEGEVQPNLEVTPSESAAGVTRSADSIVPPKIADGEPLIESKAPTSGAVVVKVMAARPLNSADAKLAEIVERHFRNKFISMGFVHSMDAITPSVLVEPHYYVDRWRVDERQLACPYWRLYFWDAASGSLIGLITTQDYAFCSPVSADGELDEASFAQEVAASLRRLDNMQISQPATASRPLVTRLDRATKTMQGEDPWRGWLLAETTSLTGPRVYVDFGDDRSAEFAAQNYYLEPTIYVFFADTGCSIVRDATTAHFVLRVGCRREDSEGFYLGSFAHPYKLRVDLSLQCPFTAKEPIWKHEMVTNSPESYTGSLSVATSKEWSDDFLNGDPARQLRQALERHRPSTIEESRN